jgi:hypothetical protein
VRRVVVFSGLVWIAACGGSSGGDASGPGNDGGGDVADATTREASLVDAPGQSDGASVTDAADTSDASDASDADDASDGTDGDVIDAAIEGGASTDAVADSSVGDAGSDGGATHDAAPDAATCPTTLLTGGTDVAAQGWSTQAQAPDSVSYGTGYVQLQTSTNSGAGSGGQLLLYYPGAVTPGQPFKIQVVLRVDSLNPHNEFDSAVAIMGSFSPLSGSQVQRSEMIYLDSAALGWADDTASSSASITDGSYHTYVLAVDASGTATVTMDGAAKLTRSGFTTNGTIAIGDQTNDANVDATIRVQSVTKLCP